MITITQIYPVPQGRNYYAVYTDEHRKSGYRAERVGFLALVKKQIIDFTLEGISGNMMKPASCYSSYRGTFSEDALKSELPELWEEIKASGDFAVEPTLWEKFMTEQRDTLLFQNEQINSLKEKIAALENDKAGTVYPGMSSTEKVYGKTQTDFDFPNDDKYPFDTDTLLNGDTFDAEFSELEAAHIAEARKIPLVNLCLCDGKKIDCRVFGTFSEKGMKTLGDVADRTLDELMLLKYIGAATMGSILDILHEYGLKLKDEKGVYLRTIARLKSKGKALTDIAKELHIPYSLAKKYLDFAEQELDGGKIT